jgi:hypothetical protein
MQHFLHNALAIEFIEIENQLGPVLKLVIKLIKSKRQDSEENKSLTFSILFVPPMGRSIWGMAMRFSLDDTPRASA